MLVQASPQPEKRPEYQAASWQPEPELTMPPPRTVSFRLAPKALAGVIVLISAVMLYAVWVPFVKHALLTSLGVSSQGTVTQRNIQESGTGSKRHTSYYVFVQYATPAGPQLQQTQTTRSYYSRAFTGSQVPIHYSRSHPTQFTIDDDNFHRPLDLLLTGGFGLFMLGIPYFMYRQLKAVGENGRAVKGLITEIASRPKNSVCLTVYYEYDDVPYQASIGVGATEVKSDWQAGQTVSLLVPPDPPSGSRKRWLVTMYPAAEFKISMTEY
jgi:hypothetical protein